MQSNPIRILQVVGIMNTGGAETFIMNLYRILDKSKYQFDFIVHNSEKGFYDDEIQKLGGKIYYIQKLGKSNIINYIKNWNSFFKSHPEYKIIHTHYRSSASIYLLLAKKYGIYNVIHSHSTSNGGNLLSAMIKKTLQYPLRFIGDEFIACSLNSGKWLFGQRLVKKNSFHIIYNAVDTKKFIFNAQKRNRIKKELGLEDKIVLGHVGSFRKVKNQEFLIDLLKYLNNEDYFLLLIGSGPLKQNISELINTYNLKSSVLMLENISNIYDYLNVMDIFCFPSLYEGIPLAVIEAQINGLPCLLSDKIDPSCKLNDDVVFLPIENSFENWKEEVEYFKTKNICRDKHTKYEEYDCEKSLTEVINIYVQLISKIGDSK